jgi:DNA-binding response OmpR family regulator
MERILVVEDDRRTAEALRDGLAAVGYGCEVCGSGEECLLRVARGGFDALVLDRMLPGCDGMEVLAALRGRGDSLPVLMLTAMGEVEARVEGFDAGADDYLTKPFAFAELLARLRRLLRPTQESRPELVLRVESLVIDLVERVARIDGEELVLTQREFDLLARLARNSGRAVSREELVRVLWGELNRATPMDNVVDVHVGRIRRKLEEGGRPRILHTIRGLGFQLGGEP